MQSTTDGKVTGEAGEGGDRSDRDAGEGACGSAATLKGSTAVVMAGFGSPAKRRQKPTVILAAEAFADGLAKASNADGTPSPTKFEARARTLAA